MTSVPIRALNALCSETSRNIQEWLTELTVTSEPECVFILYAKSFLNQSEQERLSMISNQCKDQAERIHLDSGSSLPPTKPKRCIARMTSSSSGHIMTASTPVTIANTEKYRTTVCYQLDEAKITPVKCNPAPISGFIRVKSSDDSDNTNTSMMESEYDSFTNNKSATVFPAVSGHNARRSFSLTNRSLTPKISTRGYGYRCRLRRKSQKSSLHRLSLQQQQKLTVEVDRKRYNGIATVVDGTLLDNDSNFNTSLYSFAESSSVKVDTDQSAAERDGHSVFTDNEQNLTCSRNQSNPTNRSSSLHSIDTSNNPENCETAFAKRFNSFRKYENHESENSPNAQKNDLQSFVAPFVKFRKPLKTMISVQRKVKSDKRSDLVDSCSRNPISSNHRFRIPHKAESDGQLQVFCVNGEIILQVLVDAPSSSQIIKSISNISRYSGYDQDDGIIESTSTGVIIPGTAAAAFEWIDSSTNSSVDSGQGSTDLNFQNFSSKDSLDCDRTLPNYARIANTVDHVLRACSTFHAALNYELSKKWTNELICEAKVLIVAIQCSPCFALLPAHDIAAVQQMISDLESEQNCTDRPVSAPNFLIVLLRKIIHEILIIFAKIISVYLAECSNRDRLLVIALEHLIHLMLFGDEICHVIMQHGGLDSLLYFCEVPPVSNGTLRLLLRALAILCGNYRGALKLLALNKFELIIQLLFTSTIACSAEAAGILTQLTNPNQNYVRLGSMLPRVVMRILEIVDKSKVAESLLLALAALANLTVQETRTIDILYEHNAIKRFVQVYKRPKCHNVFIEEQVI
uniref:Insc_C domain-containing protein n=1 Tax=Elaeophora elaphi TaxID=1147741 RepID=A0A0R3RL05_9BILA